IGGPILAAIVLVAALVLLADTLYKYSQGRASLWDVAFAALECIPGMKGLTTLGGLARGLKGLKGLKGMAAGLRGLGKSARGMITDGAKGAYNRLSKVVRSKGSDPVDMATGAMFLPQRDVELPGLLPLLFTRRVASDYRCGWWFGPTWASTVDQRLEIDETGVVFVTEDGLLLAYPHPAAPHVPVLPVAGPRLELTRLEDGGYRVDDPVTGWVRHFHRPEDGTAQVVRITDRNQHAITFEYDDQGAPLALRHSGGYHLKLTVEDGLITTLSLAGAGEDGTDTLLRRYGYLDGNLTEVANFAGLPLRLTYDDRLRVTSWTDSNDSSYAYAYDDRDRCVAEAGEAGHIAITLAYDGTAPDWPGCRLTTLTTAEGAVSRFVVNDLSQVVAEIDPLGHTTRTGYDEHHHVTSQTDALGAVTAYDNDALGRPLRVHQPDGGRITVAYDTTGMPTETVMPDGGVWARTYDERGNGLTLTDPAGATSHFRYDDRGRLVAFTDALGRTTDMVCDEAGLVTEVVDPLDGRTLIERDRFGRRVSETDPLGATTSWSWDPEGRLIRFARPDGAVQSWTYDVEGNCLSHTNPAGGAAHYEYTHFDLLSARTDPDGSRTEFTYDPSLRLTRVTNALGNTWDYAYDPAGRLAAESDFGGRTVRYAYDSAGRVTERETATGDAIRYVRDVMGRLITKEADGERHEFTYDPEGRLIRAVWADGELTRTHDPVGRLLSETVDGRTLRLTYDAVGQCLGRRTPAGARTTYVFDELGRRTEVRAGERRIASTYDGAGRETAREWGAALRLAQRWDVADRPLIREWSGAGRAAPARQSYDWRPDGALLAAGDARYTVDRAGRVTEAHGPDWSESYTYDALGNQTDAAWSPGHAGAEAMGPRVYEGADLVTAGQVCYERDAAGRPTVRRRPRLSRKPDVWRYTWNAQDQLTGVTVPDGTHWTYRYDPLGRRIAKRHVGPDGTVLEETAFTWHEGTLVEQAAVDRKWPVAQIQTWEFDEDGLVPLAQTDRFKDLTGDSQQRYDSRFYAIVTDLVGTPTELVDESGAVAWRRTATVWGGTSWNQDATAYTPLRFPGQYHDLETGHHYNLHRHYDPETGRYLSTDPLGLFPAPNPVTYVDNPLTGADPFGLSPYDPIRIKPGQQLPGAYHLSPAEADFVKQLAAKRPNLQIYRTHGEKFQGDFMVVDRSDPKNLVAFVVDHKMGGGNAGQQLKNAATAARHVGITDPKRLITGSGDTPKLLDLMSRGRGAWNN
ncbi:DUF6531 domain-containing protein, partial [Streptomyces sp. NPDC048002]|uniref:DUF6531 domain-containing protein n=1 Tax=Streptomyces sp. NPDC048002 TaxID=3154344 RepID=UPI00340DFC6C